MQIIRKNFGLKLLSFTIAIVGWAYIRFAGNPAIAAHVKSFIMGLKPH
jgi:hypothetical protein